MTRERQHTRGRAAETTGTDDPDRIVTGAYAEHYDVVFAHALRMTRDPDVAPDLAQEAFVRLLLQVRTGRSPDNVRAWLRRVVTNAAISRARRVATVQLFAGRVPSPAPMAGPEDAFLELETTGDVTRLLATIPDDERQALLLAAHGVAGRDIAHAIGRSYGGTRILMMRARARLRRQVELDAA